MAADWYRRHGYAVVDRNWRCPIGEIDLVVRRGRLLVVAEVKARKSDAFGVPALAVTPPSSDACAVSPRRGSPSIGSAGGVDVRFDVVAITGDLIDVYENAF